MYEFMVKHCMHLYVTNLVSKYVYNIYINNLPDGSVVHFEI